MTKANDQRSGTEFHCIPLNKTAFMRNQGFEEMLECVSYDQSR